MTLFQRLMRRLWHREDVEVAEEMEHHRALIQDLEARGVSTHEAAAASRRAMGNIPLAVEDAREVWIVRWIDRLRRDMRYGLRGLRREPGFALTAALTLALGVTATTTVFSVADAELWKPLPLPHPDRLVAISSRGPAERAATDSISGADLLDWRAATAFSDLAVRGDRTRRVLQLATAESALVSQVTANYFATLGEPAIAGRTFTAGDAHGSQGVVLTDRAWRRFFAADAGVVGRSVRLDGNPAVIIGVVRTTDVQGGDPDLFVAFDESAPAFLDRRATVSYGVIGRLRPGVHVGEARTELQALSVRVAQAHGTGRADHRVDVRDLRDNFSGYNWRPLYFFLGASVIVLLLSAVNVASLLLARAVRRVPEFALRGALGGGTAALARQLLVEGALLALPGGAFGVLLATWTVGAVTAALPVDFLARGNEVHVDVRVCVFAMAVTMISTLVFALAPLPLARRITPASALTSGDRAGRSAADGRARSVLLAAQLALTMILLCGAAVFLKSFLALTRMPLGFDPTNLSAMYVTLSGPRYEAEAAVRAYAARLTEGARAIAGVREAVVATTSPFGSGPLVWFARADRPRPAPGEETRTILRAASPGYFRTLGIPILRGREFSADDAAGATRVAVVNATLASRMFTDGEDPVGRVIELLPGSRAPWTRRPGVLQIIGVAANAKEVGFNEIAFADVYVPFEQLPAPRFELIVRTAVPPARVADALRSGAAQADPATPVTSVSSFDQRVTEALQEDRFNVLLVCGFAGIAVLLAAIGIYGAAAYQVQARTREFGIRLALGAQPVALIGAALWWTGRLAALGGGIGLAGTLLLARVLGSALYVVPGEHNGLLFGVTLTDPAMLAAAFAGIFMVAVAASAVPARQVTRVDPVRALRAQ